MFREKLEVSYTSFGIFGTLSNLWNLCPNKPKQWWVDTESIPDSLISDLSSNNVLLNLREHLRPSITNFSFIIFPANLELKSSQSLNKSQK